jgi:7-keto-8-aminopelargonate synthetase-like enzyme
MADAELSAKISTTSDIPQAMDKAKSATVSFSKQVDDIQKKFSTAFKDIFLGFTAPMILIQSAISYISAQMEQARRDAIVSRVRTALSGHGAPVLPSRGPILPWLVGDPGRALELRDRLLSQGLFVQAIRPPTVPAGTARLRVTLHAGLDDAQVSFLIDRLGSLVAGGA